MKSKKITKDEIVKKKLNPKENTVIPKFDPTNSDWIQSPYLNLQAVGWKGEDSNQGILLRWLLDGFLGDNHLPKGNYATSDNFFNKKNDFVYLYRIPYNSKTKILRVLDFTELRPTFIYDDKRLWIYKNGGNIFHLRFLDVTKYQQILATIDPKVDFRHFLSLYGNKVLEIELRNYLSFGVSFYAKPGTKFRVETISVKNKSFVDDIEKISARTHLAISGTSEKRVIAENIKKIRFAIESGTLLKIGFETYYDFIYANAKKDTIQSVGQFSLTKEKDVAFERLEDTTRLKVDDSWSKFNDVAFVNIANYQDKWSDSVGLQAGISDYLVFSEITPQATTVYDDEVDTANPTAMEISLLDFLNIASMDFHIARMLGLGYIDTPKAGEKDQFIYLSVYQTLKNPENYEIEGNVQHIYLSLPTSIADQRLPQELKLNSITYGLNIENGTDTGFQITDADGYVPYYPLRYIRLKAKVKDDFQPTLSFLDPPSGRVNFDSSLEFLSSEFSNPVFVGFEHKQKGDAKWLKPEISHETDYKDTRGVLESKPHFFNQDDKPNFIHEVTKEGIGEYAAYPVNIFSRTTKLSNIQKTDKTIFRKANTLKAPTNITVQLIQAENPLLLTSQTEQVWLNAIDLSKKEILCRLTFDYYHIHDLNYRYGNKVRIFHKNQLPLKIIGSLTSINNNDPSYPICFAETGSITYLSTGETFTPQIKPTDKSKFVGGTLNYNSKNFLIEDINFPNADGTFPKLKIRKIETREATLIDGGYQMQQIFQAPTIDSNQAFLLVENLSKAKNWTETTSNQFPFEVELGLPSWTERTETYQDLQGNQKEEITKGIWDTTQITPSGSSLGVYELIFDNTILNTHPQFMS